MPTISRDGVNIYYEDHGTGPAILLSHVVPAKAYSSSLADGQELDTAANNKLTVDIEGSTVKVGGSTVIAVDIEASNGVIHVIDTVIMPD